MHGKASVRAQAELSDAESSKGDVMGGLLFLIGISIYVWITWKLMRAATPLWAKSLIVALAVVILVGDEIWGRIRLQRVCQEEGGLKIFRTAEGVEGLQWDLGLSERSLRTLGVQFVETRRRDGRYEQLRLKPDGSTEKEITAGPLARHRFELKNYPKQDRIGFSEHLIVDQQTGEIIARDRGYSFEGGWVIRLLSFDTSGSASCGKQRPLYEFITSVLKPHIKGDAPHGNTR